MSFETEAENLSIKGAMITLVLSSMGFIIALIWRDAIQRTIDVFFPTGEGVLYAYIVAIAVTFAAVLVAFILIKAKTVDIIPDKYEVHKRVGKSVSEKLLKKQKK